MKRKSISPSSIVVVSQFLPDSLEFDADGAPVLDEASKLHDGLDSFNHPRRRRCLILQSMSKQSNVLFESPKESRDDLDMYHLICSERMVTFLSTAYDQWHAMGEGQDPIAKLKSSYGDSSVSMPLVPGFVPLPRDPVPMRPSKNVMGQIGFYCTDMCTPIFYNLKEELLWDAAVIRQAVDRVLEQQHQVVYALATHPGHHAASDSFGGYCYLNHAAWAARTLQKEGGKSKVAVLDVDYVSSPKHFLDVGSSMTCI